MIPIYELYHINSLEEINFDEGVSEYFKDKRGLDERLKIHEGLVWVESQLEYDFKELMKNAPIQGELSFSNEEIHQYLMSFKLFMESEEFKLLTDNRPPVEF